jgi:hypothetical protein
MNVPKCCGTDIGERREDNNAAAKTCRDCNNKESKQALLFLKKRSKKLLQIGRRAFQRPAANLQEFFAALFFKKARTFFSPAASA